jgi:hypothetical protein
MNMNETDIGPMLQILPRLIRENADLKCTIFNVLSGMKDAQVQIEEVEQESVMNSQEKK